jgi:hypothetical protein
MSSFRLPTIAFLLLVACGGTSERRNEDGGRSGGSGGLGGSATGGSATGGGGQGATGGSARGGSGATAGSLEGDYWIEGEPAYTFYVTVTSPTEALVGRPFESPYEYDIVHTPGASLGPAEAFMLDNVELTGEYVLRRRDGNPDAFVFALESSAERSQARLSFRSWPCHGSQTYSVYDVTAVRDATPSEGRVTPEWGLAPPWGSFYLNAERPVLAPLSAGFALTAGGEPVAVSWVDTTTPFASIAGGSLDGWAELVGQTLELRGNLHGTNGTDGPVLASIDVLDFGMHEGPVTFAALTTDVALWGGAYHYPAGMLGNCPDGCVWLTSDAYVGMRFIRPGASLRVTAAFGRGIEFMAPDGTGANVPITPSQQGVVETREIPIPFATDDLFVVFHGPYAINAGNCPSATNTAFLVSVEPTGAP